MRRLELDVMEFLRRYLQHVLPTGFMKVRYYGFMNPASGTPLEDVRIKVMKALNTPDVIIPPAIKLDPPICKSCGGAMKYLFAVAFIDLPPEDRG